ncbi:hypothetical protein IFM89_028560 [Coptis chinensis]|uniref:DUF1677 family protein n=1 Tax=Coptis chinensis TaxID=261450 RepID=A0A835IFB1_9MAGN|nr:hypothetical protein IFM89_028560 [Coptis chinensis]
MSATLFTESMAIPAAPETQAKKVTAPQLEVEFAKCACCGLTEECTLTYIEKVRERYQGRWICGLCGEAIKDEIFRSGRIITSEEALNQHMNFCKKFSSSSPPINSTEDLISAMKHIVRRSLDSPLRSTPNSPMRKEDGVRNRSLVRSGSCFSTLAR